MSKPITSLPLNHLKNFVLQYKVKKILIAISGGQDSILMINMMNHLQRYYKSLKHIEYIYIDHQWKTDSKIQIMHLINYLNTENQYLSVYQIKHLNINENIARKSRYKILIEHAIKIDCRHIITGHTKTDRIETFFINLIRGTSIDGATSLIFHRKINNIIHVLRPLINMNRIYIKFTCKKFFLPVWSDSSNNNLSLYRNRIRYEFLPYIKNYFNNKIENRIENFLNICCMENEYIKQNTIKLYLKSQHIAYIALNYTLIKEQHLILQSRILQLFFLYHFSIILNNYLLFRLIQILKHINNQNITITIYNIQLQIKFGWIYTI